MFFLELQDFVKKSDNCKEVFIEFNNVSSELQDLLKLHDGDTKKVESLTSNVNSEFNRRRNNLINRQKLIRNADRVVVKFNSVVGEVGQWCDETTKEIDNKGPVTKNVKDAKKEIQQIDVSA